MVSHFLGLPRHIFLQNILQKTKDRATRTPLKPGRTHVLRKGSSSCSTCGTRCVNCTVCKLYFPDLILKLYAFRRCVLYSIYSLVEVIKSPVPCESNKKDKDFEYNFLKICRYLNPVTIQRMIL